MVSLANSDAPMFANLAGRELRGPLSDWLFTAGGRRRTFPPRVRTSAKTPAGNRGSRRGGSHELWAEAGGAADARNPPTGAWSVLDGLLGYVPVAAFAALVAPNLGLGTPEMLPRLFGAAVAAALVLRVGHLWAGLGAGMAAYWAASAIVAGLTGRVTGRTGSGGGYVREEFTEKQWRSQASMAPPVTTSWRDPTADRRRNLCP